jgi:hypothetical protein
VNRRKGGGGGGVTLLYTKKKKNRFRGADFVCEKIGHQSVHVFYAKKSVPVGDRFFRVL